MKFSMVILLGLLGSGCSWLIPQPVVEQSYYVPVIRSDDSVNGYTPSITPVVRQPSSSPQIYTPVLR
ncbi:hypothetical protein MSP8887_00722 [Marinomonas spartinae]|uniref:Lipoprotein n=1 Tax=Marinomonas spartinae TaxID=1792290 RepID=A0A1A8T7Q0_9GAMM|nr:hypothetical protein [Marinomonas spartinae]SBS27758.1 hypothetical protein MSP8887_00722 [Marinomonas spartinae]SBS28611.1 hypothetical protein MSP8886_01245 [Marinomonas spartinae]